MDIPVELIAGLKEKVKFFANLSDEKVVAIIREDMFLIELVVKKFQKKGKPKEPSDEVQLLAARLSAYFWELRSDPKMLWPLLGYTSAEANDYWLRKNAQVFPNANNFSYFFEALSTVAGLANEFAFKKFKKVPENVTFDVFDPTRFDEGYSNLLIQYH